MLNNRLPLSKTYECYYKFKEDSLLYQLTAPSIYFIRIHKTSIRSKIYLSFSSHVFPQLKQEMVSGKPSKKLCIVRASI